MLGVNYDKCRKIGLHPECYYAECHYAECHYAECHYAECRYAECHYAECRGAYQWLFNKHPIAPAQYPMTFCPINIL
jgi:hypothetical protein